MDVDYIVVGSGLSGIASALKLAVFGKVIVITKEKILGGSTSLAQGGIAAAVSSSDSFPLHKKDTLFAGSNYNNKKAVDFLVANGPSAINWLESQGVRFDKEKSKYSLGKEAAHSVNRILHASDFTGKNVLLSLIKTAKKNKNIIFLENCFFLDLLIKNKKCFGVEYIKNKNIIQCFSKAVILSSGGLGQIYKWTTNPLCLTGDGLACAIRNNVKVSDLEFIQFHPTALKFGNSPLFLLSEALRGEGAYILNKNKERFLQKLHNLAELAPRDVVARAVFKEQEKGEVFLDIRHKGKGFLKKRFPNIYKRLLLLGFDMSKDLLPITVAQHYSCGGINVDLYGKTNILNLFAFGEVSCTGVHGANRLASNSLLEAVVFPNTLPESVLNISSVIQKEKFPEKIYKKNINYPDIKKDLQKLMWENAGILRTKKGLQKALLVLTNWEKEFMEIKGVNRKFCETKNMFTVSKAVVLMALKRKKSLGAHYLSKD